MAGMAGLRAIIPARLSRKQAGGDDGIGLDTQDQRSREFCEREGLIVIEVTRDTISGARAPMDRRNFGPWVKDPEKIAQYDVIVAYKSDRLSRGIDVDWSRIETWAADHGKRLVIVGPDGGIQYPSRHDSDYWQWTALKRQAGSELKDIRERTGRARTAIAANGGFLGRPPWGYQLTGPKYAKTITPTALGRRVIPEMFARCTDGQSTHRISLWMQEVTGRAWWPYSVSVLLRNSAYMGYGTDASGAIIYRCAPLVDAAVFTAAGAALSARPKHGPRPKDDQAMLRDAIFCPLCRWLVSTRKPSSPMYRIQSTYGPVKARYIVPCYRCAGRGANKKGCGNMVPVALADNAVNTIIAGSFDTPVLITRLIPGNDHEAEKKAVRFELSRLSARNLPDAEHDTELARLRAERDRVDNLPVILPKTDVVEAGHSYAQEWEELGTPRRGAWLAENGFLVTATREEVRVTRGDVTGSVLL